MGFAAVIALVVLAIVHAITAMTTDIPPPQQPLRVMTLNIAHGRKDGFHQVFQFSSTIRSHLDLIADMIRREDPDIVALQEADGPCWWSGKLDHVQYLADKTGMAYCFRGAHMKLFFLSYGTAILSKYPLSNNESISFPSSWPTPPKGFVVSKITWNGLEVDVVSLHLDFLRASVQREQIGMIVDKLKERSRPAAIVMGDFNCDWDGTESPLRILCQELGLKAFRPTKTEGLESYGLLGHELRLDWILLSSNEEDFSQYNVIPDIVSDHRAVMSEVRLTHTAAITK